MTTEPLIFAFDTSGPHLAAALLAGETVLAQREEEMAKGQAEHLMDFCGDVLRQGGHTWQDLDRIAVGTGPGNFTGIRISVAAARGLALGLEIPAIGVSLLEAQCFDLPRPVISAADARRGELYLQVFLADTARLPVLTSPDAPAFSHDLPENAACVGHRAGEVAALTAGHVLHKTLPLAEAIARIAARRIGNSHTRPAPLYIRPADAAPARDAPPVILP